MQEKQLPAVGVADGAGRLIGLVRRRMLAR